MDAQPNHTEPPRRQSIELDIENMRELKIERLNARNECLMNCTKCMCYFFFYIYVPIYFIIISIIVIKNIIKYS